MLIMFYHRSKVGYNSCLVVVLKSVKINFDHTLDVDSDIEIVEWNVDNTNSDNQTTTAASKESKPIER